ncbi:MAG: hypothetical protein R3B72_39200 [Polyangiaceae bacterium]
MLSAREGLGSEGFGRRSRAGASVEAKASEAPTQSLLELVTETRREPLTGAFGISQLLRNPGLNRRVTMSSGGGPMRRGLLEARGLPLGPGLMSPISSRNRVPPSAASKAPACAWVAPVKAPRS